MLKVSVVVPVYNTEKYLPKCLDSLLGQTLADIEVICINDASTDGSLDVLKKYAKNDDRIKVIDFTENKGVSVARNVGIDQAMGEYIGFVDSDDFVDLDFYEKLYNKVLETDADVVKGNIYDCDENGNNPTLTSFYDINNKIRKNPAYFLYGFTSAIYKTSFIKENKIHFPEDVTHFEDPYFSIGVTLCNPKIDFVDNIKYHYIKHNKSACANCKTLKQTEAFSKSIRLILNLINSKDISKESYNIYVLFLMQQIIPWCNDLALPDEANAEACKSLEYILANIKSDRFELLYLYFIQEKKNAIKREKENLFKQLRAKITGENNA